MNVSVKRVICIVVGKKILYLIIGVLYLCMIYIYVIYGYDVFVVEYDIFLFIIV